MFYRYDGRPPCPACGFYCCQSSSLMSFLKLSSEPLRPLTFSFVTLLRQLVGFFQTCQPIKDIPLHVNRFSDITASQTNSTFDWLRNRHVGFPLMAVSSGNRTGCHLNVLVKDSTRLLLSTLLFFLLLEIHVSSLAYN